MAIQSIPGAANRTNAAIGVAFPGPALRMDIRPRPDYTINGISVNFLLGRQRLSALRRKKIAADVENRAFFLYNPAMTNTGKRIRGRTRK